MLDKLIKIANTLDQRGLVEEADQLDSIIRSYATLTPEQTAVRNQYIRVFAKAFEKLKKAFYELDAKTVISQLTEANEADLKSFEEVQKGRVLDNTKLTFAGDGCGANDHSNTLDCGGFLTSFEDINDLVHVLGHEMSHLILKHVSRAVDNEFELGNQSQTAVEDPKHPASEYDPDKSLKALRPGSDLYENFAKGRKGSVNTNWLDQGFENSADELGCILTIKAGYECTGMEWIHANFSANREDKEHLAPEYRDANMYNWEEKYYEESRTEPGA